jgi:hypothetical protein
VRFDSSGNATFDAWTGSDLQYGAEDQWLGVQTFGQDSKRGLGAQHQSKYPGNGTALISVFAALPIVWPNSIWMMPQQAGTAAAEPDLQLLGKSDCEDPTGRHIEYWLTTPAGALSTDPYVVFEHQTVHSLAPPSGVSPLDYSGQQDKFTDDISPGTNTTPITSTQTFTFGIANQRMYDVRRILRTLSSSTVPGLWLEALAGG